MKKLIFVISVALLKAFCAQASMDQMSNIDFMKDFMQKEVSSRTVASAEATVETHCIKYAIAEDGSHMHFGIWTDGIIGTVIGNAPNVGTQVIMNSDGTIFDISYKYTKHTKYFNNKYNWGYVNSYDYKQVIKKK